MEKGESKGARQERVHEGSTTMEMEKPYVRLPNLLRPRLWEQGDGRQLLILNQEGKDLVSTSRAGCKGLGQDREFCTSDKLPGDAPGLLLDHPGCSQVLDQGSPTSRI